VEKFAASTNPCDKLRMHKLLIVSAVCVAGVALSATAMARLSGSHSVEVVQHRLVAVSVPPVDVVSAATQAEPVAAEMTEIVFEEEDRITPSAEFAARQ
jgi:hypothetical protein